MSGRRPPSYLGAFVLFVAVLAVAAGYTFWMMRAPAAVTADASVRPVAIGEAFTVRNVAQIRPSPATYARYASDDERWRAEARASWESLVAADRRGPPLPWRASDEQLVDDSVFVATTDGRLTDALGLLERWMAAHPGDLLRHLALARLYVRLDRSDDALAQYAMLLDAAPADRAARREYATALLWAQRYVPAAEQFTLLLAADPADRDASLGLARAFAWGGRAADAEPILARLWREQPPPGDTAVRTLLRAARGDLEPSARQALAWTREEPGFRPYRLALARALSRENRHAEAARVYDALLAESATVALLTEAAGARAGAGDSTGTAALLGRAVALAPADPAVRLRYAQALAWAGDRPAAIAEYTRLLARGEDAALLLARGQLYFIIGDERRALADLERSAALAPSYDAFVSVGDLYRWQGDTRRSRIAYTRALALRPRNARVLAALDDLRTAERALLASAVVPNETGVTSTSNFAEDNAGFRYMSTQLGYGRAVGRATTVSASVEQRRISQRSARARERYISGYAVGGGVQHVIRATLIAANAGVVRHALVRDVPYGSVAVSTGIGPTRVNARVATGPAYTELWSLRTLVDDAPDGEFRNRLLRARSVSGSVSLPVGRTALEVNGELLDLDDGNRRSSVAVAARQPIGTNGVRAVYSGGVLGFSETGRTYWDPERFVSQSLGVELARPVGRSVHVAVRALPGISRSTERLTLAPGVRPGSPDWAAQFSGGADVALRRQRWEATVSGGYGYGARGAGGDAGYQSLNGTLRVRADW